MITRENGFTLLEVLVAIVVLSLGLLGLAGLQAASLRNNQVAYYRSIATQQAQDIADRMRANIVGVNDSANPYTITGTPAAVDCISNQCTAANMALSDANLWNLANARLLPSGAGVVCFDSTPDDGTPAAPLCDGLGSLRAIKIWWFDKQTVANQRFVTVFTP